MIDMIETTPMAMIGELRKVSRHLHYLLEVMLVCAGGFKSEVQPVDYAVVAAP